MRTQLPLLIVVFLMLTVSSPTITMAQPGSPPADLNRRQVVDIDFLSQTNLPLGLTVERTLVGGLSAITYDSENEVYYALSDDRSQNAPARFYTLTIDLSDGISARDRITFEAVTTLLNEEGIPFPEASLDPEGIALAADGTLFISSEGDTIAVPPRHPFVNQFALSGELLSALPVPDQFLPAPDQAKGIRNNLAFESLTLTPDQRFLIAGAENALIQDGPAADINQTSLSRLIKYDLTTGQPIRQFVYQTESVAETPNPETEFRTNGLSELLALDNSGTFLALERSFSIGRGNTIRLFEAQTQGALDVSNVPDLMLEAENIPFQINSAVSKRLLADLAEFGIRPYNVEGMTLGPRLADGRQSLILIADDNFNFLQPTQFLALALTLETIPVALPALETPQTEAEAVPSAAALPGTAEDPAIWLHPTDPAQSLVIAAMNDGGLLAFDLSGTVRQTILPAGFGEIRYNNVDLLYDFELGGQLVDLAVVSDGANDTLAVYRIDPTGPALIDVTSQAMPSTIFGIDNGVATASELAAYTDRLTGTASAFVSQADGNLVAQLRLTDDGAGGVVAEVVRTLTLPDSPAKGMVVDREFGFLYVGLAAGSGIFKFRAEPTGGDDPEPVRVIANYPLLPAVEALTIYYGPTGDGYLLVSSPGDSPYAVFERSGDNDYLGRFAVGDTAEIDQANESAGVAVLNAALGDTFANGLLVVQDQVNDPQFVAENGGSLENRSTNFKFIPWENVANLFPEPLIIAPNGHDPRAR